MAGTEKGRGRETGDEVNKMVLGSRGKRTDYTELQGHSRMRPGEDVSKGEMAR